MRLTEQERQEIYAKALARARGRDARTIQNDVMVMIEFSQRGIPASEIKPRENVFTFNAWKALGRSVKKGEHGVKLATWIPVEETDPATGERRASGIRPRTAVVFHESQTQPMEARI